MTPKCMCGGEWRSNYPFGKNSRCRRVYIKPHQTGCRFAEKKTFKITRELIAKRKAEANSTP